MRSRKMTGALLASTILAGAAYGADLSLKAPVVPMLAPVSFSWSGVYLGGEVGYSWGDFNATTNNTSTDITANGILGGGVFGVRYQFAGTSIVIGAEGDLLGSNENGTFTINRRTTGNISAKWLGNVDAQVGYAWDRALFYVTGGPSYGSGEISALTTTIDTPGWGWNVGVGVDYVPPIFGDRIAVGLLYRYTHLDGPSLSTGGLNSLTTNFTDNAILFRALYRFPS